MNTINSFSQQQESYIRLARKGLIYGICASFAGFAVLYVLGSMSSNAGDGVIHALGLFAWLLMMVGIIVVLIAGVTWIYQAMIRSQERSKT